MKLRWDIFCHIVDNYGDIGVCWRLAKQLANEHDVIVRLFVDDFLVAKKIIPNLSLSEHAQVVEQVQICRWGDANQTSTDLVADATDVVLETFSCGLPDRYLETVSKNSLVWINLEYLSAENWIDNFHEKPSVNPNSGLVKHYFFPGFTNKTGGLLREKNIIAKRDKVQKNLSQHALFWQQLGLTYLEVELALKISLFAYPSAPVSALFSCLAAAEYPSFCFVSQGTFKSEITHFFDCHGALNAHQRYCKGALTVWVIPFLTQVEYDQLLWQCDVNFVRGEDSWIRGLWAGKPCIWQPYFQENEAHLIKLEAYLNRYLDGLDEATALLYRRLNSSWVTSTDFESTWIAWISQLERYKENARIFCQQLAGQSDLVSNLVIFREKIKNRGV